VPKISDYILSQVHGIAVLHEDESEDEERGWVVTILVLDVSSIARTVLLFLEAATQCIQQLININ
jgi:hypothetical protein